MLIHAGIKLATAALAMVLIAGGVFAAAEPPRVMNEDNAAAFWENLIESEKANNEQLAADASVPP